MRTVEEVIIELDPTLGTSVTDGHVTPSPADMILALETEGYEIVKKPLAPVEERDRVRAAMYTYLEPYIGRTITLNNIDNLTNYLVTSLATDRFYLVSAQELKERNSIEIPIPVARRLVAIYSLFRNLREVLDLPLDTEIEQLQQTINAARDR